LTTALLTTALLTTALLTTALLTTALLTTALLTTALVPVAARGALRVNTCAARVPAGATFVRPRAVTIGAVAG
ncbi:MAG: hypothetical protein WB798_04760, partial [Nocardioidaceae bacterium]